MKIQFTVKNLFDMAQQSENEYFLRLAGFTFASTKVKMLVKMNGRDVQFTLIPAKGDMEDELNMLRDEFEIDKVSVTLT